MSSRFFQGSDSSSESSSDEELYSEEEDREEQKKKTKPVDDDDTSSEEDDDDDDDDDDSESSSAEEGEGIARFLRSDEEDDSSEEEEEKSTIVKSAKDKRFEELEGTIRLVENAEKIGDWAVISTGVLISFNLCKACSLTSKCRIRQDESSITSIDQEQRGKSPKAIHQDCRRS